MRVAFLTASVSRNAGGLFISLRQLAQTLQSMGCAQVHVLGIKDGYSAEDLPEWGAVSPKLFSAQGPRSFSYAPEMARYLSQSAIDVVHTQGLWMYPSVAARQWQQQAQKPYLVTIHGMLDLWAVHNSRWKKRIAGWLYEHAHLHGAACLHALCEAEARAIRAYGLRNPICVIPNGIHLPDKSLLDDSRESKMLLYLGRLHPKKGLQNLLRAWRLASETAKSAKEWLLVIVGWDQSGHEEELKKLSCELGIQDSVRFLGPRFGTEKQAAYQQADAFILPSFSEGLPMAVLEAWAYELPVLMTPQCNLPEGFRSAAALRVEANPESISSGLAEFFSMPDSERYDMGRRGRGLVEDSFSWPYIAEQMHSTYRWVLGQGPQPACVFRD